jgi:hypothetical protein
VILIAWLIGLFLTFGPGAARAEVQEGGVVPLSVGRVEGLTVRNPQGALTLRGWDRPEIVISFLKRAGTTAMIERLRVQVDILDGQVRIKTGIETRGELRALPQPDTAIDLTIDAPRGVQLVASTFSGELRASGFRAGLDAGSNTGEIRVSDVAGLVRTHTGRGGQWLRAIQGEVTATGVNGDVDLTSVEGPSLTAQVVRGQITARDVRVPVVSLQTSMGTLLFLSALMPGGRYELHSDEGDVRVQLPLSATLHFSIEARGDRVRSGLPLDAGAEVRPGYLRGELRGGGAQLQLTSMRGEVSLLPLR